MATPKKLNPQPAGRKSTYKAEYCKQMIKFFSVEHISYDKEGRPSPNKLPTKESFAVSIGVHRHTLLEWCDKHPEFLDTYKKCEDLQKDMLMHLALVGLYNPTFSIFTAKNITDMKDKTEQDLNVKGNSFIIGVEE